MLRRSTRIQLVLFVIITLCGIVYVSANYIGLTKYVLNSGCTVSADFTNSGGIFTNAEVTYRGVTVGQVGSLHLLSRSTSLPQGGVRVDLNLNSCSSPRIPASVAASIHNRSVVGEQYVDLVPAAKTGSNGPYLGANANIPLSRNSTPVPTQDILLHLEQLINSVPLGDLRTTVSELYDAVNGQGPALGQLLDATNSLLSAANQPANLKATLTLIQDSATVLQTQLDEQQPLQSWTHSLNLLSQQLKKSDPDIRRLLDDGPGDLSVVNSFIQTNQSDIGVTLANLSTTGNMLVQHLSGIAQIFELYPPLAAGGQSFLHNDPSVPGKRIGTLGLALQAVPDPQDCGDPHQDQQGYSGTVRRTPDELSAIAPNVAVRCTAATSTNTNIRGSAHVPGGDPISISGGGYAYPRTATSNTLNIGPTVGKGSVVNSGSYVTMLTASLG